MKAREIKKSIEKEYSGRIKEYKSIIKHKEVKLARVRAQIEELDFLREMLFNVDEPYTFDDKEEPLSGIERANEPEVDDVPF